MAGEIFLIWLSLIRIYIDQYSTCLPILIYLVAWTRPLFNIYSTLHNSVTDQFLVTCLAISANHAKVYFTTSNDIW